MRYPVIEDFVFWNVRGRLLIRSDAPSLYRICGVRPDPFSGSNKPLPLKNSMRVLKGGGVVCAAAMSNNVVNYAEIQEGDELRATSLSVCKRILALSLT